MTRDDWRPIRRALERLRMRIAGLVTRSSVTGSTTTTQGQILNVAMLQGEARAGVEYFEPYGIAGAVPTGATALVLAVGGSRDQVVALCASPKGSTPEGRLAGEVDLYGPQGQRIRMHADGSISVLQGGTGTVYLGSDVNPAAPAANRSGDPVNPNPAMIQWMSGVTAAISTLSVGAITVTPPPGPFGSTQATTTTTRIG